MLVHTGTNDPYTLDFMRKDLKEKLIKAAK